MGRYSCRQNLRNYISVVTFNYFYSDSRKVPRITADVLTPVNSTPYDSWCTTFDFLVVFNGRSFIVRIRGSKISYDRWSDIAHMVSELPTARKPWYISFLPTSFKSRHSLRPVRAIFPILPILNHMPQTFSLSFALFCRRVLARKK